jgi:hypothetical protein
MRSPGVRIALPEPEEYAAVPSEALEDLQADLRSSFLQIDLDGEAFCRQAI